MSDDSDWDDWAEGMVAAAPADPVPELETLDIEANDLDSETVNHGTGCSEYFAPEDSSVWQSIKISSERLRAETSAATWEEEMMRFGTDASLVKSEDDPNWCNFGIAGPCHHCDTPSKRLSVRDYLLQYLPHSARILGCLSSIDAAKWSLYVDNLARPKAVLVVCQPVVVRCPPSQTDATSPKQEESDIPNQLEVSLFSADGLAASSLLISFLKQLTSSPTQLELAALPRILHHPITYTMQQLGYAEQSTEPCQQWTRVKKAVPSIPSLGSHVTFCSLERKHVDRINETWKYGGTHQEELLCRMVQELPCCGIQNSDGQLVAWCLTYPDLAMGVMFVEEEYRGQKLASHLVNHLCNEVDVAVTDVPLYCFIEPQSTASRRIYERQGFQPTTELIWCLYTKA